MLFRKLRRFSFAILLLASAAFALTYFSPLLSVDEKPDVIRNSLTGAEGVDGPILVVKIDDTTLAHPQVGLSQADVVYIEQVEGGLTRIAAIFSSTYPDVVGPVRSARISDIELLSQFGRVGFAFSGVQKKMLPVIAAANLFNVGAMRYGPEFYANDPKRIPPYAMMVQAAALAAKVQSSGSNFAISKSAGWSFGPPASARASFTSAHIKWPASSYDIKWSVSEKRWLLDHNGRANLDSTGFHLGPKTFVVQLVSITNSIYQDKVGGITPLSKTIGEGECYIFRDGGVVKGRWARPSEGDGTTFTSATGQELTFDRGQVWFALSSEAPTFTGLSPQGAATPSSK